MLIEKNKIKIEEKNNFIYTRLIYSNSIYYFYIDHDIINVPNEGLHIYPTLTIVDRKSFKSRTYSRFSHVKVSKHLNDLVIELFDIYESEIIIPYMMFGNNIKKYKYENLIKFWS